ncbi:PKAR, partial [Symbiodinium sp. KB8]
MNAPTKPQRLPTPSLRQQYYTCRHAKNGGHQQMGGSVSLPNLPEHSCGDTGREGLQFFSGQAEVLTFEEVVSDQPRDISQSGVTAPRKTPLRAQRFGSSIVSRDRVQQTLPRHIELCDDRKAVQHAQSNLEHLGSVIRDFELFGRGPEVNAAQPHRRMRGLDFLYSVRNDSAMLPKPEDEGGMKTREDNDEELQNDQRRSRVWKLLRTVPYFMTLETSYNGMTWKLSKKCQFFKEAAGQVVFRQGDPAGNCYVIVTGEVAVKIFKDTGKDEDIMYETLTQREWGTYRDIRGTSGEEEQQLRKYFAWASPKKPAKQKAEPDTHVKTMRRRSMQSVLAIVVEAADAVDKSAADAADDPERDMTLYEQLQQEDNPRYKTAEGHCTWCPQDSCLGETVVTLGAGTIFGEMALQNDKPRAATIECVQDCEFLVIPRFVYRRILKEITSRSADSLKASSILRKLDFFMDMEVERPGTIDRLAQKTAWQ